MARLAGIILFSSVIGTRKWEVGRDLTGAMTRFRWPDQPWTVDGGHHSKRRPALSLRVLNTVRYLYIACQPHKKT
jgi:hypothetical protein